MLDNPTTAHPEIPEPSYWQQLYDLANASEQKFSPPAKTHTKNKRARFNPEDTNGVSVQSKHDLWTEYGHAQNFVDICGTKILYVANESSWYVWENHLWVKDRSKSVQSAIAQYGYAYAHEVRTTVADIKKHPKAMMNRLQSNAGVKAIAELASHDPRIQARTEDFDCGAEELNTPAGVVNLRTGEITPPDSSVLVRRSTAVAPDLEAEHPLLDRFFSGVFAGEPEKTAYLQTQMGITLLGSQPTQQFMYLKGTENGADGKSRALECFQATLGKGETGYTTVSDRRVFELTGSDRHSTEIAKLAGVRMVVSTEIGSSRNLDTDKIKGLVAGDTITARYMGKDEFEFEPQFMLWVMSQHHAKADATDGAFWRRAATMTFDHSIAIKDRIPHIDKILVEQEGPAILGWMIQGAKAYLADGFTVPDCVVQASEAYREAVDTVAGWAEDNITPAPGTFASNNALRESYVRWCRTNQLVAVRSRKFGDRLEELGYPRDRTMSVRGHSGIDLFGQVSVY